MTRAFTIKGRASGANMDLRGIVSRLLAGPLVVAGLMTFSVRDSEATPINSITTTAITGGNTSLTITQGVTGTVTNNGDGLRVASITTSTGTYVPGTAGLVIARRSSQTPGTLPGGGGAYPDNGPWSPTWHYVANPNNNGGTDNDNDDTYWGATLNTYDDVFNSGNLYTGAENLFVNNGNASGTNIDDVASNIERMDFVFTSGFQVSTAAGFSVFERGSPENNNGGHGGFKIAAITGLSGTTPTSFSSVLTVSGNAEYGNGLLATGINSSGNDFYYSVFQQASTGTETTALNNRQGIATAGVAGAQNIGGAYIPTTSFGLAAGTTIYGYAIFGSDTITSNATNLLNVDSAAFPKNSGTGTSLQDMDMVASGAFIYRSVVPEASTLWAAGGLALLVISHRSRRTLAFDREPSC